MQRWFSVAIFLCLWACDLSDTQSSKLNAATFNIQLEDPVVQYLLTSSILDFTLHSETVPKQFRHCKIGYSPIKQDYGTIYYLCGEFQNDAQEWIPFVTLKTIEYEQWIGKQALVFCSDFKIIWDEKSDFSSVLNKILEKSQDGD